MDRKILWILLIVCLVIILWWAFDHVLFPDLPVPGGVRSIDGSK